MHKGRLEAFSDGVIAIIITIMVLEMKVPHGTDIDSLVPVIPVFFSYALSFIFIGIYWNNHHHMLQAAHKVNGSILWANLHLLFWMSLLPFSTGWMGENHFAQVPVGLYGINLLFCGIAYYILAKILVAHHGNESPLAKAIGNDMKGKLSVVIYVAAILICLINSWIAFGLYTVVAIIWLVPDRRFEKILSE